MNTIITINDIDLTVEYTVTKYYPATRFEPAEPSELVIEAIKVGDTDITPLLGDRVMEIAERKVREAFRDHLNHLDEDEDMPAHVARRLRNEYRI